MVIPNMFFFPLFPRIFLYVESFVVVVISILVTMLSMDHSGMCLCTQYGVPHVFPLVSFEISFILI